MTSSRPELIRRAYVAAAVTDTVLATASGSEAARRLRRLTKPVLMPLLVGTVALRRGSRPSGFVHRATLAAQALSWVGDVALLGRSRRAFLTGVGCFLGAHATYTAGFWELGARPSSRPVGAVPKAVLAVGAVGAAAMGWAAGRRDPALRLPVTAYAVGLAAMVAAANDLDPSLPASTRQRVGLGAALFMLSDLTLGLAEFVLDDNPALHGLVMATYTSGQLLIADGVAELS